MPDTDPDPDRARAEQLEAAGADAEHSVPDRAADEPVAPCPGPPTHWIKIVLVDEDGVGVADQAFLVVTPAQRELRGLTDANGRASLDGIEPGQCQVSFPQLDRDCWVPK